MASHSFHPEALQGFLDKNGIEYSQNAGSFKLTCPRCGKDEKLWILKKKGYFVCWHCKETENFKGRVEWALSEILGRPANEIRAHLYDGEVQGGTEIHIDLKDFWNEDDFLDIETPALTPIEWPFDSVTCFEPAGKKGLDYLLGRGITKEIIEEYDIRYVPSQRRVLFPVKVNGQLYGFQARAIFETKDTKIPKILTSAGMRREYMLMFHDRLIGSPHAVICEGPVDALKAHLCGGNVATMGKAVSKAQLEILREMGVRKVYLALDPDAVDEISRLASELGDLQMFLLLPPAGRKDLGECTFEEVLAQFRGAQPFTAGHLLLDFKVPSFS